MVDENEIQKALAERYRKILDDVNEYDEKDTTDQKLKILDALHRHRCAEEKASLDERDLELKLKEYALKERELEFKKVEAKAANRRTAVQTGVTIGSTLVGLFCFLFGMDWERGGSWSSKTLDVVSKAFRFTRH